jgi:hypothetical protein
VPSIILGRTQPRRPEPNAKEAEHDITVKYHAAGQICSLVFSYLVDVSTVVIFIFNYQQASKQSAHSTEHKAIQYAQSEQLTTC